MTSRLDLGASRAAIEAHYDVGNAFYALWLDPTMTYTCALWSDQADESLETAQLRKIDFHAAEMKAQGARRVLDVGCGWGGALRRLVQQHGVGAAVGLTLSPQQHAWQQAHALPGTEVRLEPWAEHQPTARYDAIQSICALEAFARDGLTTAQKVAAYRSFFEACHDWLEPGGHLTLQTVAYGNSGAELAEQHSLRDAFPESDLPHLSELAAAFERRFEPLRIRNDRAHYSRTLRAWRRRLRAARPRAVELVGEPVVQRFEEYLRMGTGMFDLGTTDLLRITLRRIDSPRLPPAPGARTDGTAT